jgi:hypothetical protein
MVHAPRATLGKGDFLALPIIPSPLASYAAVALYALDLFDARAPNSRYDDEVRSRDRERHLIQERRA